MAVNYYGTNKSMIIEMIKEVMNIHIQEIDENSHYMAFNTPYGRIVLRRNDYIVCSNHGYIATFSR